MDSHTHFAIPPLRRAHPAKFDLSIGYNLRGDKELENHPPDASGHSGDPGLPHPEIFGARSETHASLNTSASLSSGWTSLSPRCSDGVTQLEELRASATGGATMETGAQRRFRWSLQSLMFVIAICALLLGAAIWMNRQVEGLRSEQKLRVLQAELRAREEAERAQYLLAQAQLANAAQKAATAAQVVHLPSGVSASKPQADSGRRSA